MANQGISKSATKLIPKDPTSSMVTRDIIPNQITTFSVPFLRFGHVKLGGRGTVVKLRTGNLAVFSPVALTDETKSKIQELASATPSGQVRYIVAPDFEHHIFVGPWAKEYPDAAVVGMEGLPEKREQDPDTAGVKFTHVFTKENKETLKIGAEFDEDFEYEYVHAHMNKELVFFHKPSRTLIEADLLFNLPATEQYSRSGEDANSGIFTKLFCSFTHTSGQMKGQQRLLWYGPGSADRKAFKQSIDRIQSWGEFDRLIPCHGDVIETGGSKILAQATAWFKNVK